MSLIRAAIPLVLGLVMLELLWGAVRRRRVYRLADSVADFGCAAMSQIVGLSVTAVTVGGYAFVAGALNPFRAEMRGTPLLWITVFLLVDLGQYLLHRLSHRVNVLWACHAVHHSSEEFNYAVGLRNSSFHGFLLWIFFLPLAVAGVPWRIVAVCYGLNVLYQFWLHTRLVGRLGPLEAVLNTPSHHRVHHGTEPHYLDRNFAGVLIVWDRLFGTFRAEAAEPRYGTVTPLASWNPVWANLHGFALIAYAWQHAPDWRGKLAAVFGPPGQADSGPTSPGPVVPRPGVAFYAAGHLALAIAAILGVVLPVGLPGGLRLGTGVMALATLGILGGLLDGRRWAGPAEGARLLALIVVGLNTAESPVRIGLVVAGAASALWLAGEWYQGTKVRERLQHRRHPSHDQRHGPHQIQVHPRGSQESQPHLLIDDQGDRPSDQQIPGRVDQSGRGSGPAEIDRSEHGRLRQVMCMHGDRHVAQDQRQDHQAGAVGRGHEERPDRQLTRVHFHPTEPDMPRPDQPEDAETDE